MAFVQLHWPSWSALRCFVRLDVAHQAGNARLPPVGLSRRAPDVAQVGQACLHPEHFPDLRLSSQDSRSWKAQAGYRLALGFGAAR